LNGICAGNRDGCTGQDRWDDEVIIVGRDRQVIDNGGQVNVIVARTPVIQVHVKRGEDGIGPRDQLGRADWPS